MSARSLVAYDRKRDFARTSEPRGKRVREPSSHAFVVQWHKARRDHFDFRLELDGVLKSWAVTRGPSANPVTRRLAVRTEDHPLEYAAFEGVIPQGSYGAGPVIVWDRGTWLPANGDPRAALDSGLLKFTLAGERMKGRWALVRIKPTGRRENWLLVKDRDAFAEDDDTLALRFDGSVASGRTFAGIASGEKPPRRVPVKSSIAPPAFVKPMLCKTAAMAPNGDGWLYEMKYDGYRLQLAMAGGAAALRTRNGHDWTAKFPEIADASSLVGARDAIIDGEAVVLDSNGVADFSALVQALEAGDSRSIVFIAFDVLQSNGLDQRPKSLRDRKQALAKLFSKTPRDAAVRLAPFFESAPDALLASAVAAGGEGLIAKKAASAYRSGRSPAWLKVKAKRREDAAIVGWYPSSAGRKLASIAVAFPEKRRLRYAGRVGTGFDSEGEAVLISRLRRIETSKAPAKLDGAGSVPAGVRWVKPSLTAAIVYAAKTGGGMLRGASYLGLREDAIKPSNPMSGFRPKAHSRKPPSPKRETPPPITHAERVVFPAVKFTKGDIADYYERAASRLAPHLDGRPVSLLRAPDSIDGELFFQRHPMSAMKAGIIRVPDSENSGEPYLAIDGADGLRTAVQFGAVELHGWGARLPDLDAPDRLILDLDPGEDVPFEAVKDAAHLSRRVLSSAGLKSFPLVSGGKGIHVVAPLDGSQSWEDIGQFTSGIARLLARSEPSRFIAKASKLQRKGRIYIDWLRNKRSATAIVPWSLRARPRATIARPVSWRALAGIDGATAFEAASLSFPLRDPWPEFFVLKQRISREALKLLR